MARAITTLVLIGSLVLAGCSKDEKMTKEEQFAQLIQRPDVEQMLGQYENIRHEIADRLSQQLGLPTWSLTKDRGSEAGCGREFPDVGLDGVIRSPENLISPFKVPDESWDSAVRIAESVTSKHNFESAKRVADAPGNHQVEFHDPYGGRLAFGTQVHTLLSVRTGCHLTPSAHQRGKPS